MPSHDPPAGDRIDDHVVDGRDGPVRVRDYLPATRRTATPFLWLHGGGFVSGGLDQKESHAPALALASAGRWVRTVDYRLAPVGNPWRDPTSAPHPGRYPAALHDVLDAAASLAADAGAPIAIGGASAGANLAAAAVLRLRDEGSTPPRAAVLAYGTFHVTLPPDDRVEAELTGPMAKWAFGPPMMAWMNLNYVGDPDLMVPGYAFPGGTDLSGFPPTLVLDAANDRLRRSGHAFADELRSAGTQVREIVVPSTHGFLNSPKRPAFTQAVDELADWLSAHD